MLRRIQGVVLGFLVNVAIGMTSVVLAYSLLGPERVFRPGLYESSGLWIAIGIVLAIVAGWASGWVAARVGGWKAVVILAIALGVLGVLDATYVTNQVSPERPDPTTFMQAVDRWDEPLWSVILGAILNVLAVLVGGRRAVAGSITPAVPGAA